MFENYPRCFTQNAAISTFAAFLLGFLFSLDNGSNIRSHRLARDISIVKLAGLVGITHGYLGLIERGRRGFTLLKLLSCANVFDISIDTFFRSPQISSLEIKEPPIGYVEHQKISSLISEFFC